jgi:1,4-dihydroxy-2-naphthoate octaprenyltransferase
MPVFLFALSQSFFKPDLDALLTFVLLHLFVYPASNAYNSYNDIDLGSVGGMENPPPSNAKVLYISNILDFSVLLFLLVINTELFFLFLTYIIASRLYSYRRVRLKKYPYVGFLVIFIFQGAFTYYLSSAGNGQYWGNSCSAIGWKTYSSFFEYHLYALLASSFQIGAIYPLTQIYQHESDLADGVTTLSYKLGYRGTFIFSAIMFGIATIFYYLHFKEININSFYLLLIVQLPIIAFFVYWARKVWKDTREANYKNTMYMNVIAAAVLNLFFLYLVLT